MQVKNSISCLYRCETSEARYLQILDVKNKLKAPDMYDIGGTSTNEKPDLWFYFTTLQTVFKNVNLLNLFVCIKTADSLSIGISNSNKLTHEASDENDKLSGTGRSTLPETLMWKAFNVSEESAECHHVTTFSFTKTDLDDIGKKDLFIPIRINIKQDYDTETSDLKLEIKLNYNFNDLLKNVEKDLVLESASKKEYPVHRILLLAHVPAIRDMLRTNVNTCSKLFLDVSNSDIEMLCEYLYTGTLKELPNNCKQVMSLIDRFQLQNLNSSVQSLFAKQITVDNAVDLAVMSEKQSMKCLQAEVFGFIKLHPEVLETEAWLKLDDVDIAKKLLQFVYKPKQ